MQSPAPFARIGTRGSPLALTQARLVRRLLCEANGVSEDDIAIEVIDGQQRLVECRGQRFSGR